MIKNHAIMKKQTKNSTNGIKRCLTRKYKEMMKGIESSPEFNNPHSHSFFKVFSLYDNSKYETQTSCSFNSVKV